METAKINIQLNFRQLLEAVKQLSPAEKLQLNEAIWEEGAVIPIEHQQLVLERKVRAKQNPDMMFDWDDVSKTL